METFATAFADDEAFFAFAQSAIGYIGGSAAHVDAMRGPSVIRRTLGVGGVGVVAGTAVRVTAQHATVLWLFYPRKERRGGMGVRLLHDALSVLRDVGVLSVSAYCGLGSPVGHRTMFLSCGFRKAEGGFCVMGMGSPTGASGGIVAPFPTVDTSRFQPMYSVRPYREAHDRKAWRALVTSACDFTHGVIEFMATSLTARYKLVVVVGDVVVGLLALDAAWLTFVTVGKAHRKVGLGALLLAVALDVTRRDGERCLGLRPLTSHVARFYERYGFLNVKEPREKSKGPPPMSRRVMAHERFLTTSIDA